MDTTRLTLSELAVTRPGATRVFQAHGLDFCCGGHRPLTEACRAKGLDADAILGAIEREDARPDDLTEWTIRPLGELADHIEGHYHARLRRELPELIALAEKVERVHAGKPDVPAGLTEHLRAIHAAVLDHLAKEEQILFPMIRAGRGPSMGGPVRVMEDEHEDHGRNLRRTRERTGDLIAPPDACATWRALYLRLAAFEAELMEHIHLENNVLYPRALCS